MRTTTAVIKLYLKSGKTLADGTNPIMLKVSFKGTKERATGFSTLPKQWDERTEQLKKGYPNYVAVNAILRQQKEDAMRARDKLVSDGLFPSPEAIIQAAFQQPVREQKNDLFSLVDRYVEAQHFSSNTVKGWKTFKKHIEAFNRNLKPADVNDSTMSQFAEYLKGNGLAEGTIFLLCGKLVALLHYAVDMDVIPQFPIKRYNYARKFVRSHSEIYIHSRAMDYLFQLYYEEVLNSDGQLKYDPFDDKKVYALYAFLLGYTLKGLSPVDMLKLKWSDIRMKVINGKHYYAIDGHRQKTRQPFKIRLPLDDKATDVLLSQMRKKSPSEVIIQWTEGTLRWHRDDLQEWCDKANDRIRKYNAKHPDKIEEIDTKNITFYAYRHSYIMSQLLGGQCNLIRLAQETGKSYKTLWQYMSQMQDEDLI